MKKNFVIGLLFLFSSVAGLAFFSPLLFRVGVDRDSFGGEFFGSSIDGDLLVSAYNSAPVPNSTWAKVVTSATAGTSSATVSDCAKIEAGGYEILIIQMAGPNAGQYEFKHLDDCTGDDTANFSTTLKYSYDSDGSTTAAQMMTVPHYQNVTIDSGSVLSAEVWDGSTGGVLAFRVAGTLSIASGAVLGGSGGANLGWAGQLRANFNEGFRGYTNGIYNPNQCSTNLSGCTPGGVSKTAGHHSNLQMGTGGSATGFGVGGNAGGVIIVFANEINLNGTAAKSGRILINGGAGSGAGNQGGAGGTALITVGSITGCNGYNAGVTGSGIDISGGTGGAGGNGENGRLFLHYQDPTNDGMGFNQDACQSISSNTATSTFRKFFRNY